MQCRGRKEVAMVTSATSWSDKSWLNRLRGVRVDYTWLASFSQFHCVALRTQTLFGFNCNYFNVVHSPILWVYYEKILIFLLKADNNRLAHLFPLLSDSQVCLFSLTNSIKQPLLWEAVKRIMASIVFDLFIYLFCWRRNTESSAFSKARLCNEM